DWESVLTELEGSLIETEFKPDLLKRLREISKNSTTLTEFFAKIMVWLFGHHGLILLDSGDSELRSIESQMFQDLIKQHEQINVALLDGKNNVTSLGYEPQAEIYEEQVNLFIHHEGNRLLLKKVKGGFADKKEQIFFS